MDENSKRGAARLDGDDITSPGTTLPRVPGFAVRLEGAPLHDLVQLECLGRTRKIVRVRSGVRTGFLYFRDGNVVHAQAGAGTGEAAFGEILRWPAGVFETWMGEWPAVESISLPWQALLLRAAHNQDEGQRGWNVLSFPLPETASGPVATAAAPPAGDPGGKPMKPSTTSDAAGEMMLRLAPNGRVLAGNGNTDLAEAAAYIAQIVDLVGDLMGLERCVSVELTLSNQETCLLRRLPNGELLAARVPAGADVEAMRRQVGVGG